MQPGSNVERFQLEEEYDGVWFHSGIDGTLFVPDHKLFYAKEKYCIDYFYDKDGQSPEDSQVR